MIDPTPHHRARWAHRRHRRRRPQLGRLIWLAFLLFSAGYLAVHVAVAILT